MKLLFVLVLLPTWALTSPKYATIHSLKLKTFDPANTAISFEVINRTFINVNMTIFRMFPGRVVSSVQVKKSQDTGTQTVLSFRNVDFCSHLERFKGNSVVKHVFSSFMQPTYFNKCPLREGFYYVKDGFIEVSAFESFIPYGVYHILADISLKHNGTRRYLSYYAKLSMN